MTLTGFADPHLIPDRGDVFGQLASGRINALEALDGRALSTAMCQAHP
jgi:hypothetical protein